jgi:hypothetical protein
MSSNIRTRVTRWAAALTGVTLAFMGVVSLLRRVLRIAKGEAEARGSDVSFVLGAAERGRSRIGSLHSSH